MASGVIAITLNGRVQWLAHYGSLFSDFDKESSLAFMKAVLQRGPGLLAELCPPVTRRTPEQELVKKFLESQPLTGAIDQEVLVGKRRITADKATFDWRKSIDLVVETDADTWVIEAKPRLNYAALGEKEYRPVTEETDSKRYRLRFY